MAEGDLAIQFDVRPPPEDVSREQQRQNERLHLPEAVEPRTIIVVGSGPSANDPELWERLKHETAPTVALNGALKLFLSHGMTPTYWAACDPQEAVMDFLPPHPPLGTTYLVATKVRPAVFDRLRGREVRKWRLDDYERAPGKLHVQCAVSITLVTLGLFRLAGYHRFETYGWDCCFLDGEHHASAQPAPAQPAIPLELHDAQGAVIGTHDTTGTWMAEIQDAAILARNFSVMGYEIVVHGPGLVGKVLRGQGCI